MGTELHRRFNSHPLTSDQVERTAEIRTASYQLAKTIEGATPAGREQAAAIGKVEEAMFMANAAVARPKAAGGRELTMAKPAAIPADCSASPEVNAAASLRRCGRTLYVEHVDGHVCRVPLDGLEDLEDLGIAQ